MGNQEDPCYKFVEFHPSTTGVMTQKTKSSVEFHPSTEFKPNKESKSLWKSNGADPVNATYVIYLEGNQERYEQVVEQLNQIQPTDTIWIVHNKGYKNHGEFQPTVSTLVSSQSTAGNEKGEFSSSSNVSTSGDWKLGISRSTIQRLDQDYRYQIRS